MSDITHPGQAQPPDELGRSVEVRLDPADTHGYTGVVKLRGEHDLATGVEIQDTLEPIFGNGLVDLSECDFIDSTVISVLIREYQARAGEGPDLDLFAPLENAAVARALEIITCTSCGKRNRVAAGIPRCGNCHTPLPWIVEADAETVDAALDASVAVVISARYDIQSIPLQLLAHNGHEVDRLVGAVPPPQLRGWLESRLEETTHASSA